MNIDFDMRQWYLQLSKLSPKWIYRYRSFSKLNLKELNNHEVFFSYNYEVNDPFDMQVELIIEKDEKAIHKYFISSAFNGVLSIRDKFLKERKIFTNNISTILSTKEWELKELIKRINVRWLKEKYISCDLPPEHFNHFFKCWCNSYLNLYPNSISQVSFTKNCLNPMMWAMYADGHHGYCLAFLPKNKEIRLKKLNSDKYQEFRFHKMSYDTNIKVPISLMFNKKHQINYELVYSTFFNALEKKAVLTKNPNFSKEREYRIYNGLNTSFSHLCVEDDGIPSIKRVYQFDPTQLAAIILGQKLNENEKVEIETIAKAVYKNVRILDCIQIGNTINTIFRKF